MYWSIPTALCFGCRNEMMGQHQNAVTEDASLHLVATNYLLLFRYFLALPSLLSRTISVIIYTHNNVYIQNVLHVILDTRFSHFS